MAAYMVIFAKIHDRAQFLEKYGKPAAEVVAKFGGRYVVRAPGAVSLEGGFGEGQSVVISEWADKAAIERFWNSPDYAPLRKARQSLAEVQVVIVEQPK
jgi:uncharacterized protein (DUF1330 family)